MAISVGVTKDRLVDMAKRFRVFDKVIPSGKGGKLMKDDLIPVIREHILSERYGSLESVPNPLRWILSLRSPMLAARIDQLKEEQQKEVWEFGNFRFEEKLNGVRTFLVCDCGSVHLFSRHSSDKDLLPVEFTEKVRFAKGFDSGALPRSFILDGELLPETGDISNIAGRYGINAENNIQAITSILSSSKVVALMIQDMEPVRFTFTAFDCLFSEGDWLLDLPLSDRLGVMQGAVTGLQSAGFLAREVSALPAGMEPKQFFKETVEQGGEGLVAKRLDSLYHNDTTRGFQYGWVKIKRGFGTDDILTGQGFGDTYDGFITGFEPGEKGTHAEGLIGAVKVSTYIRDSGGAMKEKPLALWRDMPQALRVELTDTINGEPMLKPKYFKLVVELDGQGLSEDGLLKSPHLVTFRYDKNVFDCILENS